MGYALQQTVYHHQSHGGSPQLTNGIGDNDCHCQIMAETTALRRRLSAKVSVNGVVVRIARRLDIDSGGHERWFN